MTPKENYKYELERGQKFEQHVAKLFRENLNVELDFFIGKKEQLKGETHQGIEIKFDDKMKDTGNLYIECAEKSHPALPGYFPGGIYRDDNTWLYAIGDYDTVYLFGKEVLQNVVNDFRGVETPTSQGFLIPVTRAEALCIQKL